MKLSDFVKVFVAALYNETMLSGKTQFRVRDVLDRYTITMSPVWRDRVLSDKELQYYVEVNRHIGPTEDQRVALTPEGFRFVEDEVGDNLMAFLEQHGAIYVQPHDPTKPSDESSSNEVVGGEGIPASDRIVSIDHNSAEYVQVRDGIAEIKEAVRQSNSVGDTPEARDRIIRALDAASSLWEAYELRLVQIKVGLIMAIEDAGEALNKCGKQLAWSLVVDLIKSLVKSKTGIDM